ncbi:transcription antitermination factor NusB [Acetanaerobacterium elongatum]|uniref:Transcription antitermination protein NusB n=1 Tax=Acetanaerobacterium elongatum TaxID=258515 RepID=A0A1H0AQL1_9FIRM|nr:transcription antitermination factor NusB [Acetanaerobacterium elongatum]SDN35770.1 NusB antitermination factor [Acetanaerobacterium elongatum]
MSRREAREQAFILIFEKSFRTENMQEIIDLAVKSRELEVEPFAAEVALHAVEHFEALDARIERLSLKWKMNRISKVAFAILRLALYEMIYESDIPVSVSINEAVELAKKYAGEEDSSFVNGVLGAAAKELEADKVGDEVQGDANSMPEKFEEQQ